jgi:class 3 adenylate cyclase
MNTRATTIEVAAEAIEGVIRRAARRGEFIIAWTRLVGCGLGILQEVAVVLSDQGGGPLKETMIFGSLFVAIAISLRTLFLQGRDSRRPPQMRLSVVADALLMFGVFGPAVIWPHGDYFKGFLRTIYPGFFMIATIGSGVRLNASIAVLGIITNGLFLFGMVAYENIYLAERLNYDFTQLILVTILFIISALLAVFISRRTIRLVHEGGQATLQAEKARQRLGVYVSKEIADQALAEDSLSLGGTRQPMAVLFSDLRGFTRYAEDLAPESLVDELNAYLDAMVGAIEPYGGLVDKFIGDAIMVVFGIPQAKGDEAVRAIRAASAMRDALTAHNQKRKERGLPPLKQGIGVHFGDAVAGNIGTADRMQFTVVGDVVNLASRLETATKELSVDVVISEDAVKSAQNQGGQIPALRSCGTVSVKGRTEAVAVFTLEAGPDHSGIGDDGEAAAIVGGHGR